ncbi:MAG: hypothetical protein D6750_10685 [Bacteroidetes bacterium]|nr:MAG: hypothetical protein D6750_10685 [Bacteroidota bacterium]
MDPLIVTVWPALMMGERLFIWKVFHIWQKFPPAQVLQFVQRPVWEEVRQLLPMQVPHCA